MVTRDRTTTIKVQKNKPEREKQAIMAAESLRHVGPETSRSCCRWRPQWSFGYIQGLVFIFLVALIWAGSSILVQSLYTDFSFDSPFLLTYIGSSLFTLWLPTHSVSTWILDQRERRQQAAQLWRQLFQLCWRRRRTSSSSFPAATPEFSSVRESREVTTNGSTTPVYRNISSSSSHTSEESPPSNDVDTNALDEYMGDEEEEDADVIGVPTRPWTHRQHLHVAMWIAPVWFVANWTYNASLQHTSITSSTVLASTGSLFTFLFAVLARDESFGWLKLLGVVLGVLGSCFTAFSDAATSSTNQNTDINDNDPHWHDWIRRCLQERYLDDQGHSTNALWGDVLGLLSAVGYGGYAVQTRMLCPHNESLYSMQLILGYIGLLSGTTLAPVAVYVVLENGSDSTVFATWWVLGALIVKGLLDNVLSDFLWLRAVMLTSATVATVGLGMTIPLAFLSDIFWLGKSHVVTFLSTLGALSVLAGFVLVNVGNEDAEHTNNNNHDENGPRTLETSTTTRPYPYRDDVDCDEMNPADHPHGVPPYHDNDVAGDNDEEEESVQLQQIL